MHSKNLHKILTIVPETLQQELILRSVDNTTIAKWDKHFDGVGILCSIATKFT